jgi:hypothetical protein
VPQAVYIALGRLLRSGNLRNLTLTVVDNGFDARKAQILYEVVAQGNLKGLTFINRAQAFDFRNDEYSDFNQNVQPLKQLPNCISDVRWDKIGC